MYLKLNDEFLEQCHLKEESYYDDNYYRLPFTINCDGEDYNILRIVYDELTNEYRYSLCYELEGLLIDSRYIIPSAVDEECYKIDLDNYSKEMIWL